MSKPVTILLIDHHRARFFDYADDNLVEGSHLEPLDPHGFLHHLEHRKEADYSGQRAPEATEFYDRIAERLKAAPSIVLVGDATGKSSAVRYFALYLKEKHSDVAARVLDTVHADLSAIDLGEIRKIAERYANVP
jgi:hypothetical protein